MVIYSQNSFAGGLDRDFDPTKIRRDSYPLLVNGRIRENIVVPTKKHLQLNPPSGTYQGIYAIGSFIVIFISGVAYYADISSSPITFQPIKNWTTLNQSVSRIYAELIAVTSNFFNRYGDSALGAATLSLNTFNNAISSFPAALFVTDGVNQPQAIYPNGEATVLAKYTDWRKDKPEYVPVGILPAQLNNKLFLVSPDRKRIYHSVSGRMTDFVVNIDNAGNPGGNAETVSAAVSGNDITAIRPLSSGQLLVGTLYGTYVLNLEETIQVFGEPYLRPVYLFPTGPVNELSVVDILQDTAFITQSGIHGFNTVAQANRESNNAPLGAKIRGLLQNPQKDTCATVFDDYAFFAVNTIFGYGAIVFDTIRQQYVSLDLSFGQVKQFAVTKLDGRERMFFITAQNELFEAFAGSGVNSCRIYVGEFTPNDTGRLADTQAFVETYDLVFSNIKSAGQVKITTFTDQKIVNEAVLEVNPVIPSTTTQVLPFQPAQTFDVSYRIGKPILGWKSGLQVEWNFDGALTDICVDGEEKTAENTGMAPIVVKNQIELAFIADSGFDVELNPGGTFGPDNFLCLAVEKGASYIFEPNGNGNLVQGGLKLSSGVFTSSGYSVAIQGTGPMTFSLRRITNFAAVMEAINKVNPMAILGGGDHCYNSGTVLDVSMGLNLFKGRLVACAGNHEYDTDLGKAFFAAQLIPRYFSYTSLDYVDFFFYNGGWTSANVGVDSNGVPGPTSEPDGNDVNSKQFSWLKYEVSKSTKPFKILIVHEPPYTTDNSYYPGYTPLRLPYRSIGISAVLSGHGHNMEKTIVNGFPYFVCGTGGRGLRGFRSGTTGVSQFRNSDTFGYLYLKVDSLTCLIQFRDTDNNILHEHALYA